MDGTKALARFLVTVSQDDSLICALEISIASEHDAMATVNYHGNDGLEVALQQLEAAVHCVQFQLWKETGRLPAPSDFVAEDPPWESSENSR